MVHLYRSMHIYIDVYGPKHFVEFHYYRRSPNPSLDIWPPACSALLPVGSFPVNVTPNLFRAKPQKHLEILWNSMR